MDILFLLIPVSFIFIIVAIRIFFWAVGDGQFDDLDGAAHSILFDKDKDLLSQKTRVNSASKLSPTAIEPPLSDDIERGEQ